MYWIVNIGKADLVLATTSAFLSISILLLSILIAGCP